MNDYFIYVSQIPRKGSAGQNKFEKCIIEALLNRVEKKPKFEIKIFSASTQGEKSEHEKLILTPLKKKNYPGYIAHQILLFLRLGCYLWTIRKNNLFMFVRYHDAMIAPLILSFIFNVRLSIRTGPVLPSLSFYNKNPSKIVFLSIKWVLGLFYKKASAIVTVTEKIKQWAVKTYKLDPDKVIVVPNAADTTLFFPEPPDRQKWGLPENEFVIGFVGNIIKDQGLDTVIQALGILKKNKLKIPYFLIVGSGEHLAVILSQSKELRISEFIVSTGNIPHEEVRSAINACDRMLIPLSKKALDYQGASSLKSWEYLACDKPIIASHHKDHQYLEELSLGRMVEPDNAELWAETLAMETEKKDFGLQGRGESFILAEHSYELIMEKLISISLGKHKNLE